MTEELRTITIDGEACEVNEVHEYTGTTTPLLELDDGTEWYVAESNETAGEAAREYWEAMAQDDPEEFASIVGEKTLVAWALGQYAGPGSTQVQSLDEWLDLWLDTPEEHFASYDGNMWDAVLSEALVDELGFGPDVVAYRHN